MVPHIFLLGVIRHSSSRTSCVREIELYQPSDEERRLLQQWEIAHSLHQYTSRSTCSQSWHFLSVSEPGWGGSGTEKINNVMSVSYLGTGDKVSLTVPTTCCTLRYWGAAHTDRRRVFRTEKGEKFSRWGDFEKKGKAQWGRVWL